MAKNGIVPPKEPKKKSGRRSLDPAVVTELRLAFGAGFSLKSIAEYLKISVPTVRKYTRDLVLIR